MNESFGEVPGVCVWGRGGGVLTLKFRFLAASSSAVGGGGRSFSDKESVVDSIPPTLLMYF